MTISGLELAQINTSSLAYIHKFYPAKIAVHHHQLRHFISTSELNRIYYVNDYDIYLLDLDTHETYLLATVPFEARCLAADHGWVCVGGEQNGDCAFIRVEEEDGIPKCFGHDLIIDVLGGEIVNSMNIELMYNDNGSNFEPIVLISNNDKTVKIYSLARREVLTKIEHETPMNYAAMSPCSSIIATVGDSDIVHFYKRQEVEHPDKKSSSSSRFTEYEWLPLASPVAPTGDEVYDDYSFAVTFSPSGHLCAASSQGGAITVFDMQTIRDEQHEDLDPIVCTFRSSRSTLWGCVRAMAFSPEPWDLIAWAEDHGRIGVADIRHSFLRRQILHLDKQAAEIIQVEDQTPTEYRGLSVKERLKQQHSARLRSMRGHSSPNSNAEILRIDNQQDTADGNRNRQGISHHQNLSLDARERSVLEALETTIDNVEHVTQPYSLNYTASPRFRPSSTSQDNVQDLEPQSQTETSRAPSRLYQPRRRTSVILSEAFNDRHLAPVENVRTRISASPGRIADDDDVPIMSTNDLTPTNRGSTSQPLPYNIPPSDPWHAIQSALDTARQAEVARVNRPATLTQIEAALEAERRLGGQLERQLQEERQLSTLLRRQLETQERLLQSQERDLQTEQRDLQAQHRILQARNRELQVEHQVLEAEHREIRARNRDLHAERDAAGRVEPTLEALLHRELESEQQFGEHRSRELEAEIRLGTSRARRLEAERLRLIGGIAEQSQRVEIGSSAHSTSLPTTNLRTIGQPDDLAATFARHQAFRQQRLAHIESLERQVRRAESRVASASSDIQALENAIHRSSPSDVRRQSEIRRVAGVTAVEANERASTIRARAAIRRAEVAMNADRGPPSRPSELAGRTTEAERNLARMMFLTGPRALDNNGNWVAGGALHRALGRIPGNAEETSLTDVMREVGVGTTGIGWSPDGRYLYAGSEEGIFEYKVNMQDRMTFPSIELR